MDYERRPDAIYSQSFAMIEAECDLSQYSSFEKNIVKRMIHASGDISILKDIYISQDIENAFSNWLGQKDKQVICDVNMVKMGVIKRFLPTNCNLISAIDQPNLDILQTQIDNTKTAAGMHILQQEFEQNIVVVGNAPTALFYLLELLDQGLAAPNIIIGCPVGFVGAAESKQALIEAKQNSHQLKETAIISLSGRLGGSAIASSALNALCKWHHDQCKIDTQGAA